ncbi:MAG: type II secretion system GspH family protein [Betaproteobacteria bacterium]|nr:type II secretion system GspH family protein [Betaproteobacteria bacterium]
MRQRFYMRGFTIVELLVTVAIVGILASAIFPLAELSFQRGREQELRGALRELRNALDAYRQAVDDGRILKNQDESGYPKRLEDLVDGVPDAKNPKGGRLVFLRRIPRDPMVRDAGISDAKTWGKRSYASPRVDPREGEDVFDVYSLAPGNGMNGIPYREW